MQFDLHIHSHHSDDSASSVAAIINRARAVGLKGIAITDHNTLAGSQEALQSDQADILIIPGAEYSTDQGHILVYFLVTGLETLGLEQDSRQRFGWQDVVDEAHKQGALAFWAHPFTGAGNASDDFIKRIDGIEIYNGRAANSRHHAANQQAMALAQKHRKPVSAGSDAHWVQEMGTVFLDIKLEDSSTDPADVMAKVKASLQNGKCTVRGRAVNRLYKPFSQILRCFKTSSYKELPKVLIKLLYAVIMLFLVSIRVLKRPIEIK